MCVCTDAALGFLGKISEELGLPMKNVEVQYLSRRNFFMSRTGVLAD